VGSHDPPSGQRRQRLLPTLPHGVCMTRPASRSQLLPDCFRGQQLGSVAWTGEPVRARQGSAIGGAPSRRGAPSQCTFAGDADSDRRRRTGSRTARPHVPAERPAAITKMLLEIANAPTTPSNETRRREPLCTGTEALQPACGPPGVVGMPALRVSPCRSIPRPLFCLDIEETGKALHSQVRREPAAACPSD
jgi:hypothetical protein